MAKTVYERFHVPDLIEFQRKAHACADEHGWWQDQNRTRLASVARDFEEIRPLIVSELMEAFEEYRNKRMSIWYKSLPGKVHMKPEGFGIELADAAIRILDFAEHEGMSFTFNNPTIDRPIFEREVPKQLDFIVARLYASGSSTTYNRLRCAMWAIWQCAGLNGINLMDCMLLKHSYNLTREYRHGDKQA